MDEETDSEFGKGCVYCLGLFLAHESMKTSNPWHWFNGASDHLYELEIPDSFPVELKDRIELFTHKALEWGHGYERNGTEEDKRWALREAKDILMEIDKYLGIQVIKGTWE